MLLELHGRVLRLVCGRTGKHFVGLAVAAGWLANNGCKGKEAGKVLKTMRQMDVVAAWVRHVTSPKCDGLVASVGQLLDRECEEGQAKELYAKDAGEGHAMELHKMVEGEGMAKELYSKSAVRAS